MNTQKGRLCFLRYARTGQYLAASANGSLYLFTPAGLQNRADIPHPALSSQDITETKFHFIDMRSFGLGFTFLNDKSRMYLYGGSHGAVSCDKKELEDWMCFRLDTIGIDKSSSFRIMSADKRKFLFVNEQGKLIFGSTPNSNTEIWFEDTELLDNPKPVDFDNTDLITSTNKTNPAYTSTMDLRNVNLLAPISYNGTEEEKNESENGKNGKVSQENDEDETTDEQKSLNPTEKKPSSRQEKKHEQKTRKLVKIMDGDEEEEERSDVDDVEKNEKQEMEIEDSSDDKPERRVFLLSNKIFHVIILMIYVLTSAGLFFNWPSALLLFEREEFYAHLCENEGEMCVQQELKFTDLYNLSIYSVAAANCVFGILVDIVGPKITAFIGGALLSLGSFLMIFSSVSETLLSPGVFFIAFGGPGVYYSSLSIANLFTYNQLVLSCLTGMFALSTLMFLIFDKMHAAGVDMAVIFSIFTVFSVVIWIYSFINIFPFIEYTKGSKIIPFCSFRWRKGAVRKTIEKAKALFQGYFKSIPVPENCSRFQKINGKNLFGQFFSFEYLLGVFFLAIFYYNQMFYMGTLHLQLQDKGATDNTYVDQLTIICQIGSVACIIQALAIDHIPSSLSFTVQHLFFIIWAILNLYANLQSQTAAFIIFSIWRACFPSVFVCYIIKYVGFRFYGTLIGLAFSIAQFMPATHKAYLPYCIENDFEIPNFVLFVLGVLSGTVNVYCFIRERKISVIKPDDENE